MQPAPATTALLTTRRGRAAAAGPAPLVNALLDAGSALGAAALTILVGVSLGPWGAGVAWVGMLGGVVGLAWIGGRMAGVSAAATGGLVHLAAARTPGTLSVSDPAAIRLGLLLGVLGTLAACLVSRAEDEGNRR